MAATDSVAGSWPDACAPATRTGARVPAAGAAAGSATAHGAREEPGETRTGLGIVKGKALQLAPHNIQEKEQAVLDTRLMKVLLARRLPLKMRGRQ